MSDIPETSPMSSSKINGFDKWEVEEAARTLIKAQQIPNDKRKGFYNTVKIEVKKQADAAQKAAVEAKAAVNLHKVFGGR
jgi:hypothetical protein